MLLLEWKRSRRSQISSVAMLIDVHDIISKETCFFTRKKFINLLSLCTRESDIKGWYSENHTLGIIYTDIKELNKAVSTHLVKKVKQCIDTVFTKDIRKKIKISYIPFPEPVLADIEKHPIKDILMLHLGFNYKARIIKLANAIPQLSNNPN